MKGKDKDIGKFNTITNDKVHNTLYARIGPRALGRSSFTVGTSRHRVYFMSMSIKVMNTH